MNNFSTQATLYLLAQIGTMAAAVDHDLAVEPLKILNTVVSHRGPYSLQAGAMMHHPVALLCFIHQQSLIAPRQRCSTAEVPVIDPGQLYSHALPDDCEWRVWLGLCQKSPAGPKHAAHHAELLAGSEFPQCLEPKDRTAQ